MVERNGHWWVGGAPAAQAMRSEVVGRRRAEKGIWVQWVQSAGNGMVVSEVDGLLNTVKSRGRMVYMWARFIHSRNSGFWGELVCYHVLCERLWLLTVDT